ncbi:probable cytochrome P450 6a14 [Camponotus floridanus]|uniref:probable cytochrome P450 6a14 n=1 Tax=Camponotus floridanus TaxID=104421 RepID=UPI000DC677AA|nr:probable cytochrome P450 6a14 [Camponotus floridanus]
MATSLMPFTNLFCLPMGLYLEPIVLPKIHKTNIPFRLIVSSINSPLYSLALFLHKVMIKNFPIAPSHINNSFDLVHKLADIHIDDDSVLISLDVTSLFTNIPVDLALSSVSSRWRFIQNTCETLRKYPVATHLMRHSTSSYTFGGSTVNIPKNLKVFIPVFGIHRDPDIYPKPDVFDPERFNDEAIQTRHPMHYLPFGDGPRNCIGARFGIHQTKIGLIKILRNYKVEICDKTQIPYINNSKSLLLAPKDGIHLRIIKINQT